jgi:GNAT superfamily N-acetyltransferase
MVVRRAVAADVAEIAILVERYWAHEGIEGFDSVRVKRLLRRLLKRPALGGCWILAGRAGLQGYLVVTSVYSLEHGGLMAEVDELFVRPQSRSRGGGAALVKAAERALAAEGCVRVQLQLGVRNRRARTFYRRHGYRRRAGYELWDKPLATGRAILHGGGDRRQ